MQEQSFTQRGAVDLSAIAGPASGGTGGAASNGASYVIEVTEETFQTEVINRSVRVPVLIDFWADWCGPCKQLSPILERLAGESGGRWVLAKIDVDANQRVAAAFAVQGIPAVFAVIKGQPVPVFTGALPEPQVRQYIDEVLRVAAANGVSGTVESIGGGEDEDEAAEPAVEVDLGLSAAQAAIDAGDLDGAATAFKQLLDRRPGDPEATSGLARVELLQRVRGVDAQKVRRAAADNPDDAAAQALAADLDLAGGHVEDAFARLIETVRRTSADSRDSARLHLLALFEVVGPTDPRVTRARSALASALF